MSLLPRFKVGDLVNAQKPGEWMHRCRVMEVDCGGLFEEDQIKVHVLDATAAPLEDYWIEEKYCWPTPAEETEKPHHFEGKRGHHER